MKKILSTFLLLAMLMTSFSSALALAFDLSSLSDAEIMELSELLNNEYVSRNIEKTASLPPGTYIIGKDIPVGKYVFKHPATEGWFAVVQVRIQDSDEDVITENVQPGKTFYLNLEEGQIFICDEPFELTISMGARFI